MRVVVDGGRPAAADDIRIAARADTGRPRRQPSADRAHETRELAGRSSPSSQPKPAEGGVP